MLVRFLSFAVAVLTASFAAAQTPYPNKPITLVVPYTAGGTSDIYARLLAERLQPLLGQRVLVENRPGASQIIGAQTVARAPKDGYTLLFTAANTMTSVPLLFNNVSYKAEDFTPISMVARNPYALTLSNSFKGSTFQDLVAYAKANPGKVTYGTTGFGTGAFLAGKALEAAIGVKLLEVPFKGLADASIELAAGRIDLIPGGLPEALQAKANGTGRILAIFDATRAATAPDVPTMKELGYSDLVIWNWYAVFAPAGTPKEAIDRMADAIGKAAADATFKARLSQDGMVVEVAGAQAVAEMIDSETKSRRKLIEDAEIEKQ